MHDDLHKERTPEIAPRKKERAVGFRTHGAIVPELVARDADSGTPMPGLRDTTKPIAGFSESALREKPGGKAGDTLENWAFITEDQLGLSEFTSELNEFEEIIMIDNIQDVLGALASTSGFVAAALVDANSGMTMGSVGGNKNFDVEIAAATNTDVVRAKMRAMEALELDDHIEDILITLDTQYHLIRPLSGEQYIFLYLAVDRKQANLALCRRAMAQTEEKLKI